MNSEKSNLEISFEAFYRKYFSRMVSYAHYMFGLPPSDAEDIAENAFIELLNRWSSLQTHTETGLLIWIRKTVKYMSYTLNRKKNKEPLILSLEEWITLEETSDPCSFSLEDHFLNNEMFTQYLDEIRKYLNSKQLQLFEYAVVMQYDVPTTAKLLGLSNNTVKVSLKRLRAKLKNEILPEILNGSPTNC